MEIDERSMIWV